MDWFPIVFGTFKVIVLSIGMFFAVKWHYDKGNREKQMDKRAVLRAAAKVVAIFLLSLLGLGLLTYIVITRLSLDLTMP